MLVDLADNSRTDKNTFHSYLPLYEELLCRKRFTARNVLEVGICFGGSIKMWNDYFSNACVYSLDILHYEKIWDELKDQERIRIIIADAYDKYVIDSCFKNKKFDFILDDGPHTLISQLKFLELYSPLLEYDGILIIEDIQDINYLEIFKANTPDNLKPFIKTFDLRKNKGRYDDIVFCIDLSIRSSSDIIF
jgi:cephalosporin hydroxylase